MQDATPLAKQISLNITKNAANQLTDKLRGLIITGELPPNYMFPNENIFCEQLGIGRGTLREAYKALEATGLVSRTKRGTFVNDSDKIISSVPFSLAIEMSEFNDVMEFRIMTEAELARLAAQRSTVENIQKMRLNLELMRKNQTDLTKLTYYDMQFHMEIAKAADNKFIYNVMMAAVDAFSKSIYNAFQHNTASNIPQALSHHELILEDISKHDEKNAQRHMRSHINSIRDMIGAM